MISLVATILLLSATTYVSQAREVCVEGFIMDQFCIDRGTLLDAPSVVTLENPELHSVHCIVDVPECYNTDFTILFPNAGSGPKFGVALKLDGAGKTQAISIMRNEGICTTCKNGNVRRGYRGTFFGELDRSSTPPTLKVRKIVQSPKALNTTTTDDGCPNGADNLNLTLITESGGFIKPATAHASLMIIGWGFLLPTGVSAAHFLKHRPNALWFKMHRIVQVIGLIIAILGWIVALATFDVFSARGSSYNHGALGMTVMVLGILQPINAFIRPHPPKEGESRPFKRLLWEIVHKGSGYLAILLAAGTILYGTFVISVHQTAFRAAWGITLAWLLVFILSCVYDSYRYKRMSSGGSQSYNTKSGTMN